MLQGSDYNQTADSAAIASVIVQVGPVRKSTGRELEDSGPSGSLRRHRRHPCPKRRALAEHALRPLVHATPRRRYHSFIRGEFRLGTRRPPYLELTSRRGRIPIEPLPEGRARSTAFSTSTATSLSTGTDPWPYQTDTGISLRSFPRDERDFVIAARSNRVLSFDNLSGLSDRDSDTLCKVATGAGFATRQLNADFEEVRIEVRRPVILNGIDNLATRQNAIDRAIVLSLPAIPPDERR